MWIKYLKPYKIPAIVGFVFKMIEAFFELIVPLIVAQIIDEGISSMNPSYVWKNGIILFIIAFSGYGCALICQYFASYTSQGFGTYLRNDMFKKINAYDYENLDEIGIPSLITRMTNDVNQLQLAVAMAIRLVSRSPFLILGSLIMAFGIDAKLAIIFLLSSPLLAFSIYMVISKSLPLYVKIQKKLDHISLICRENLSGVRVIRAFSKQKVEKQRFQEAIDVQKQIQTSVGKLSALLNPVTNIIVNLAIICILYVGGIRIQVGSLTQGEVIALINYMNQILLSMFVFANVIVIFNKASASYRRVNEVLSLQPKIKDGDQSIPEHYDALVRFDHVSFAYQNANVLQDISFSIRKGETIGIIGGTGSGKTTLIHLLCRFYEATCGHIYIKDVPIQQCRQDDLRKMIGLVSQKVTLFSGSIEDNLKFGYQSATQQEIKEALSIAQGDFVYSLSRGLNTKMEQDAKNFSGGQKQRLAIARALIKKPELLLLDDSMSALDFATDAALRKELGKLETTTVIVSQRISSIKHADKILVLRHGKLEGMGTHQELMQSCQVYQEIASSQTVGGDNHE